MIFLNFSGIFDQQPELAGKTMENAENRFFDLKKMTGVNGYCSEQAAEELSAIIGRSEIRDVHFLDNGNYHYVSCFFLKKIGQPFELVVFDHHTDMQPPGLIPCLSCGSWMLFGMEDAQKGVNQMKRAVLIGPAKDSGGGYTGFPEEKGTGDVVLVDEENAGIERNIPDQVDRLFGNNPLPVYISIDKDVLSEDEVRLNWDQGTMSFDTLALWIEAIARERRVIGLDICGEPLYNQFPDENVRKSEKINLRLLELARRALDR